MILKIDTQNYLTLDRETVEKIYNKLLCIQDEGPEGSGWKSDELTDLLNSLSLELYGETRW